MSSNYQTYLNYLASFADDHSLAVRNETDVYPLFVDIKKLIIRHNNTISKFANVQSELITFVEQLAFDENDFDYYKKKIIELAKIDEYLQELKMKQVPASIANEIQTFIINTYSSTSLYKLEKIEEAVLAYHNKAAEVVRYEQFETEKRAKQTKTIIVVVVVLLVIVFIVATCNH